MSQSDVAYGFRPADDESPGIEALAAALESSALSADKAILGDFDSLQSSDDPLTARILQLEQALDQALACIRELRSRLRNQSMLEAHLVRTEEFSHAQQQAIARLKQQLKEQQHAFDAQQRDAKAREKTLQELVAMAQAQREELEMLRNCLFSVSVSQDEADPVQRQMADLKQALDCRQQHIVELETELWHARETIQLLEQNVQSSNGTVHELTRQLQQQQTSLLELETQLEHAYASLAHQQNLILTLRQTQAVASERNTTIAALQKDLAIAQMKVGELETQLAKETRLQASWKQRFKELESRCDRQQLDLQTMQQEKAELQEQVFQQANSVNEYETAVQHWKERHFATQHRLAELKALCAQIRQTENLDDEYNQALSPALLQLINAVEALECDKSADANLESPGTGLRLTPLELPDFLLRRRSYRPREL